MSDGTEFVRWIKFDPQTGDIAEWGQTQAAVLGRMIDADPTYMPADDGVSGETHRTVETAGGREIVAKSPETPPEPDLDAVKAEAMATVDRRAEAVRLTIITGGAGQMGEYLQVETEARAALQEADPQPSAYPVLASTLGIEGDTLHEIATKVVQNADAWRGAAAAIRRARLGAKAAIDAATTPEAARAAAQIDWTAVLTGNTEG